jgi:hypothetical protein
VRSLARALGVDVAAPDGPAIFAGCPSARRLRTMSSHERTRLRGRVVLALSANQRYAVDHIIAATQVARVGRRPAHAQRVRIGHSIWYVLRRRNATRVLKVQHGTVEEVGIANHTLTATLADQRPLLAGF